MNYYCEQTFLDWYFQRTLVYSFYDHSQGFQIHGLKMMACTSVSIQHVLVNSGTRVVLSFGGSSSKDE